MRLEKRCGEDSLQERRLTQDTEELSPNLDARPVPQLVARERRGRREGKRDRVRMEPNTPKRSQTYTVCTQL
jgi:hypothetical protein